MKALHLCYMVQKWIACLRKVETFMYVVSVYDMYDVQNNYCTSCKSECMKCQSVEGIVHPLLWLIYGNDNLNLILSDFKMGANLIDLY